MDDLMLEPSLFSIRLEDRLKLILKEKYCEMLISVQLQFLTMTETEFSENIMTNASFPR